MQWVSSALLGLLLLCLVQPVHCCRRRSRRPPPPPPPPNKNPVFPDECKQDIEKAANRGELGTTVTWSDSKVKARDLDSSVVSVTRQSPKANGSYFTGTHTVIYRAVDGRNGVAYCHFNVRVTVKYCWQVPPLQFGHRSCQGAAQRNLYGSNCTSSCYYGYALTGGDEHVQCQDNGVWFGAFPTCRPVSCGNPGTLENGVVQCSAGFQHPHLCFINCNSGYQYGISPNLIRCQEDGAWSELSSCLDTEDPTFPKGCPPDQTLTSGPLGEAVEVTWTDPETADNSGEVATLTSSPANGSSLLPGRHTVTITATDWSGNHGNCRFDVDIDEWTCEAFQVFSGSVQCTSGYLVGSLCHVTCNAGYRLQGNGTVTCVSSPQGQHWSSSGTSCVAVRCSEPQLDNGKFDCPNGWTNPYACTPDCDDGFTYDGPQSYIQCSTTGMWTSQGTCTDDAPPVFPNDCPDNIDMYAAALGQATLVTWDDPEVTDNSGLDVVLTSDREPGSEFLPGDTLVRYTAVDPAGNTEDCTFKVSVKNLACEKPDLEAGKTRKVMLYDCPDWWLYGATCTLSCTYGFPLIGSSNITCMRNDVTDPPTMFWKGDGPSAAPPTCAETTCPDLKPPKNGALSCHLGNFGYDCLMACQEPYDVPASLANEHFQCPNSKGYWIPDEVPDCTEIVRPGQARVQGDLFYYANNCNISKDELRENFITRMNSHNIWQDACINVPSCVADNVEVHCGSSRKKREEERDRDRQDVSDAHHISRRQSGSSGSTHYVLVTFDLLLELTDDLNVTMTDLFQMGEEVQQKLYEKMVEAVENGTFDEPGLVLDSQAVGSPTLAAVCPEGTLGRSHPDRFSCVGCSKGLYLSGNKCEKCPVGTYSDIDNSTACTPCPNGTSTETTAAKSSSECKEQCLEGKLSPSGFTPCEPCPAGQYQSSVGAKYCEQCPVNFWTHSIGAFSTQECVGADLVLSSNSVTMEIGSTWSSLTVSLKVGFPDENSSVTVSVRSSSDGSVLASHVISGLSKVDNIRESKQRLFHHFTLIVTSSVGAQVPDNAIELTLTELPPNSTTLTVQSEQKKVRISSLAAFGEILTTGEISSLASSCSVDRTDNLLTWSPPSSSVGLPTICDAVDECSSSPCGSHGVCVNLLGGYECQCQGGWSGVTCNDPPNPCQQHRCQNGATCTSAANNYTCACPHDYTGEFCEVEKVHGGWTQWLSWTHCACGTTQERRRSCTNPTPQEGGDDCDGDDSEVQDCTTSQCSDDEGSWSTWDEWTECSTSCAGGETTRQRTCEHLNGTQQTAVCEGSAHDRQVCNTEPCPVHGGWSPWPDTWTACSVTCAGGTQTRGRTCDNPAPAFGGADCSGSETESQPCATQPCPKCDQLKRPVGGMWVCNEYDSPYFISCTLKCLGGRTLVHPSPPFFCGHNTSYVWSHQRSGQTDNKDTLPHCSATRMLTSATYSAHVDMNTACDQSTATDVEKGIRENIDNQVPCRSQDLCQASVTTGCKVSRKRSVPSLQISLTAAVDLNITDSDVENNETMWTAYLELMAIVNQSVPDENTLESLLTVALPGGQVATPDMTSAVVDVDATCTPGSILRDLGCVECPPGTMEVDGGSCVLCPVGFYQDQPAATSCKPCPPWTTWDLPGATSLLQCVFPLTPTKIPFPTTPKPKGDQPMNEALVIGLSVGITILVIIIVIIIVGIYCKTKSKNQRTSRQGSRLSLSKIFPSVLTVGEYPMPFFEQRAPPSYQQAIETGAAPVHPPPMASSVENRKNQRLEEEDAEGDWPSARNVMTTSFGAHTEDQEQYYTERRDSSRSERGLSPVS